MQRATLEPQGSVALDDRELEWVTPEVRAPARFVVVAFSRPRLPAMNRNPRADPFSLSCRRRRARARFVAFFIARAESA
jgi:hypothetical protein